MNPIDRNLFAYYSPEVGTVSINYFFDPSYYSKTGTSLPSQLLVGSDFSQQILLFSGEGDLLWSTYSYGRSFTYHEGALYAAVNQTITNIDMATGAIRGVYDIGGMPQFINSSSEYIVAGVRPDNASNDAVVKVFKADNALWNQSPVISFPIGNGFSRDAELNGQHLIVADTFNHNVKVYDVETGTILYQKGFFFPNDIAIINDNEFLVAEEHGNRIWSVNWVTGARTIVMSSPSSLYADPDTTVEQIQAEQTAHMTELPGLQYPIGNSAVEVAGQNTLYSPNSVILVENGFIVADTDNHRVLLVRDNEIKAVWSGINNPIRIQPLNDQPTGPNSLRVNFTSDGKPRLDLAAYQDPNSDELFFRLTNVSEAISFEAPDGTALVVGNAYSFDHVFIRGSGTEPGTAEFEVVDPSGAAVVVHVEAALSDVNRVGFAPVASGVVDRFIKEGESPLALPEAVDGNGDSLTYTVLDLPEIITAHLNGAPPISVGQVLTSAEYSSIKVLLGEDATGYLGKLRFLVSDNVDGTATLEVNLYADDTLDTVQLAASGEEDKALSITLDPSQISQSGKAYYVVEEVPQHAQVTANGVVLSPAPLLNQQKILTLAQVLDLKITPAPDFVGAAGHLILNSFDGFGASQRIDYAIEFVAVNDTASLTAHDGWVRPGGTVALSAMLDFSDADSLPAELSIKLSDVNGTGVGGHFTLDGTTVAGSELTLRGDEIGRVSFVAGAFGARDVLTARITDEAGEQVTGRWVIQAGASPLLAWDSSPVRLTVIPHGSTIPVIEEWWYAKSFDASTLAAGGYSVSYASPGEPLRKFDMTVTAQGFLTEAREWRSEPGNDAAPLDVLASAGAVPLGFSFPVGTFGSIVKLPSAGTIVDASGDPVALKDILDGTSFNQLSYIPDAGSAGAAGSFDFLINDGLGADSLVVRNIEIDGAPGVASRDGWVRPGAKLDLDAMLDFSDAESLPADVSIRLTDLNGPGVGGYFTLNGTPLAGPQLTVRGDELDRVRFVAGADGTRDVLTARITDDAGQQVTGRWMVQAGASPLLAWESSPVFLKVIPHGSTVSLINEWWYGTSLDASKLLPAGAYSVSYARPGEPMRNVDVTVTADGFLTEAQEWRSEPGSASLNALASAGAVPLGFSFPDDTFGRIVKLPSAGTIIDASGKPVALNAVFDGAGFNHLSYIPDAGSAGAAGSIDFLINDGRGADALVSRNIEVDGTPSLTSRDGWVRAGSSLELPAMLDFTDAESLPADLSITLTDVNGPGVGGYFTLDGTALAGPQLTVRGDQIGRVRFVAGADGARDVLTARITDEVGQHAAGRWMVQAGASPLLAWESSPVYLKVVPHGSTVPAINGWWYATSLNTSELPAGAYSVSYARPGEPMRTFDMTVTAQGFLTEAQEWRSEPGNAPLSVAASGGAVPMGFSFPDGTFGRIVKLPSAGTIINASGRPVALNDVLDGAGFNQLSYIPGAGSAASAGSFDFLINDGLGADALVTRSIEIDGAPGMTSNDGWVRPGGVLALPAMLGFTDAESRPADLSITLTDVNGPGVGGYFTRDGKKITGSQLTLRGDEIDRVHFVAGADGTRDVLTARITDEVGQQTDGRWMVQAGASPLLAWESSPVFLKVIPHGSNVPVINEWWYGTSLDASKLLPAGAYRVAYASPGEPMRNIDVTVTAQGFLTDAQEWRSEPGSASVNAPASAGAVSLGFSFPDDTFGRIVKLPTAGTIVDASGKPVALNAVLDGTSFNQLAYIPDAGSAGAAGSFDFMINDGRGADVLVTRSIEVDGAPGVTSRDGWLRPGAKLDLDAMLDFADAESLAADLSIRLTDVNGPGVGGYFTLDGTALAGSQLTLRGDEIGRVRFVAGADGTRDVLTAQITDEAGQQATGRWMVQADASPLLAWEASPVFLKVVPIGATVPVINEWWYGTSFDASKLLAAGDYRLSYARPGEPMRTFDVSVTAEGFLTDAQDWRSQPDKDSLAVWASDGMVPLGFIFPYESFGTITALPTAGTIVDASGIPVTLNQVLDGTGFNQLSYIPDHNAVGLVGAISLLISDGWGGSWAPHQTITMV